jgi:hypothetical protein
MKAGRNTDTESRHRPKAVPDIVL